MKRCKQPACYFCGICVNHETHQSEFEYLFGFDVVALTIVNRTFAVVGGDDGEADAHLIPLPCYSSLDNWLHNRNQFHSCCLNHIDLYIIQTRPHQCSRILSIYYYVKVMLQR